MFRTKSLRRAVPVLLAAVAILAAGGGAVASNMAFKLNKPLFPIGTLANEGQCWTALPALNPYPTIQQFCTQTGLPVTATILQINPDTGAVLGPLGCTNTSALTPRFGIRIVAPATVPSIIIVGSHDPSQTATFYPSGILPNEGQNWFPVPYHTTAITMRDMCLQAALPATATWLRVNCDTGAVTGPFGCASGSASTTNLILGEAVRFTIAGAANINFTPAHF